MVGVKIIWGSNIYYYNFIFFISLEITNTEKRTISSGNVHASVVVTCPYPQIY